MLPSLLCSLAPISEAFYLVCGFGVEITCVSGDIHFTLERRYSLGALRIDIRGPPVPGCGTL